MLKWQMKPAHLVSCGRLQLHIPNLLVKLQLWGHFGVFFNCENEKNAKSVQYAHAVTYTTTLPSTV